MVWRQGLKTNSRFLMRKRIDGYHNTSKHTDLTMAHVCTFPHLHHNFENLITVFSCPFSSWWHITYKCPDIFQREKHLSFVQKFLKWLQSSIFQTENNITPLLCQSMSSDQKQVTGLSLSIQGRKAFSWINYFLLPNILWSLQSKFKTSIHFNLLLSGFVLKAYLDFSLIVICTKVNKNSFSLSKTNCCSILTTA